MICGFILISLPAFAAGYSTVVEDLPLMPSMMEHAEEAVVFDKPAGRIVETAAETASSSEDIQKFYYETLPPLGWKNISPLRFSRDNEKLYISIERKGEMNLVHFSITPVNEGK